jgi:hypothetical protein
MLVEVIDFPEEFRENMQVMSGSVLIDGVAVTYGKVYDLRDKDPLTTESTTIVPYDPMKVRGRSPVRPCGDQKSEYRPLIPTRKRQWYSPMSFSVFDGRLSFMVSTHDWSSGDLPMKSE